MEDTKKLEEKLANSERENEELKLRVEELTDFFENASLPLHWVNGEGVIIWANQAELDALGYTKEEYIGFPISNFHADQEVIQDILNRLINNETLLDYSAKLKCKDGSIKHVLINSNVLRKDGEFIHTRCFTRDITEKIQEDQRKNDFVSMVSHELKTPLIAISSYVELLIRKTKKDDGFNFMALTRIHVQAKKMTSMIHDFLNLSRLEDGQMQLNREMFSLRPLVEEIIEDAQVISTKHTLNLLDFEAVTVFADREKIGQVLMNLVSNALKYSPNGGTITVGCIEQPGIVNIYVSDEGIGINKADQKKLFQRFYRVNNEKIKAVAGFGIGLYLVSEILLRHNSHIQVKSREGLGSTFLFDLEARNG